MDAKMKRLKEQRERAGGAVMIGEDIPDALAELFLREIMSCPDCEAEIASQERVRREREH